MKRKKEIKVRKIKKRCVFKTGKKFFSFIYWLAKTLTKIKRDKNKSCVSEITELSKINRVMKYYYKREEFIINSKNQMQSFTFKSEDGVELAGLKYITNPDSKKWLISSHWFAGDKYWALVHVKAFIELGYNILVYDFRNHGQSEKTEVISMGLLESKDLIAAIKYLNETEKVETLGLFGMSMGAYITNYITATQKELLDKSNVKFAISDSTYASLESLLYKTWRSWFKLFLSRKSARKIINKIIKSQQSITNQDQKELNLFTKYEDDNIIPASAPTLFIHGVNDKITSHTDSLRLYIDRVKHCKDDEILLYNSCNHCFALKDHYYRTVYSTLMFENKIIKDHNATKKALEKMNITKEIIKNNFNEIKEVATFHFCLNKEDL
ncbi:alpha/beta hydrolase [Mycoplasma yeatsii]|uniref:Dipeptidyl aminopeptidase/acylaminoacyl peptidase n=1 Tax=Mycoplasma yeatsii TaxID=51365 RepID=A0ABU0NE90_9MOLU|nr:alpha/beta hydrolase [Mycoplasma yeatsii]MDQ0567763.1 dipeptidyl aminopeptidase/acylaminoacyl peptidase [Mycoplasma yeatsii]